MADLSVKARQTEHLLCILIMWTVSSRVKALELQGWEGNENIILRLMHENLLTND